MVDDRFEVHMQYKSAATSNTQSWYFTDLDDSRLNIIPIHTTSIDPNNKNRILTGGGNVVDNGKTVVLMEILTTSEYDDTKITTNHNEAKAQGYLMLPTDWTNFEVTFYAEFLDANSDSVLEVYGRSGKHINGRPAEGIKYNINITSDGHIIGNIKHFHSAGIEFLQDLSVFGDIEGRRIGFKFIVYNNNTNSNNTTAVRIEVMVDVLGDNNWDLIYEYTDTGDKTKLYKYGDENTKMITWGGPIIGLNVINFPLGGLAIDKFSVREIDALAPKVVIPTPPAPVDPEAVSAPTAPPSDAYRTDLDDDDWDDDVIYDPPTYTGE